MGFLRRWVLIGFSFGRPILIVVIVELSNFTLGLCLALLFTVVFAL